MENFKIYKTIFNKAAELILIFDQNGFLTMANNRLVEFTTFSDGLCLGKPYTELPFFSPPMFLQLENCYKNHKDSILESTYLYQHSKKKKPIIIQTTILAADHKEPFQLMCKIHEDLSRKSNNELYSKKMVLHNNIGYKAIFDNSPEVIMIVDNKGIIVDANKKIEELTSYSVDSIINLHFKDLPFITKETKEKLSKNFVLRSQGHNIQAYEIEIKSKSKQTIIGSISGTLIKNPIGDYIGSIIIMSDITKKKQVENALKKEREFSNLIFEENINAILIINEKKKIVAANKKSLELLGEKKENVISQHCNLFFHSETPCPFDYTNKSQSNFNCKLIKHNNEEITINKTVSTFHLNGETFILESFSDVSKQIKMEKALLRSKERYKQLTENNDEVFWIIDSQNVEHITYVSPAFEKVWGISVAKLYAHPHLWKNSIHKDDRAYVSSEFDRFFKREKKLNLKYRIYHKDKSIRWIWNKGFLIHTDDESSATFAGIIQDVTLQHYTKEALFESSKKYKSLFEFVADSLLIIDPYTLYITDANEAACEMYRYDYSELLGKRITELTDMPKETKEAIESKEKLIFELTHKRNRGETFPIELKTRRITIEEQTIYLCSIQDISRHRDLEQKMLRVAIETEEKERRHIAENLHDDIGPFLSGIMMYVYELSSENTKASQKKTLLSYLEEMVDQAIVNTKTIAYNLTPAVLSDYGLIKAVENFCAKMNQLNTTHIRFVASSQFRIDKITETIIYRIITELVNNSLKHSKTENILLNIHKANNVLQIEYKDYGIGFNLQEALKQDKGLGLRNILNRLNSIQGTYSFESEKGQGIIFKFRIKI